jgi:hypothetical protein
MFAVFRMDDLVAFRSVGLDAVLATGITGCDHDQLARLCMRCGWDMPTEQAGDQPDPHEPCEAVADGDDSATPPGPGVQSDSNAEIEDASLSWGACYPSIELCFVDGSPAGGAVHGRSARTHTFV